MRPSSNLELTNNEEALILAVREMDQPPTNILLWYIAGLENALKNTTHEFYIGADTKKIEICRKWMNRMK